MSQHDIDTLRQQNAELAARVEQLEAAIIAMLGKHLDCDCDQDGRVQGGQALASPSPAVVKLNAAARELADQHIAVWHSVHARLDKCSVAADAYRAALAEAQK